ncbi:ribonuclease H family protein [Lysinibacillus piscis]|uniref:ribonuclease H n=1 Tax=Lysinibacillus piscis TaxID=2518931 RepID=A0ABQ5NNW2_9BACI|nr:ribonuclease H family protein [Lysinibacillus sp. KH24]GLC89782.1 RNase H [Lysinibacillus sp. KH24]
MAKFYAVKAGREVGVFSTWAECEKQVKGFRGAQYKSFPSKEEAEQFVHGNTATKTEISSTDLVVYVDGSYSNILKTAGFGCIFLQNNEVIHTVSKGTPIDPTENLWNVSAEIEGVLYAVHWAIQQQYSAINVFYDYQGLEKWATGEWKANKKTTQRYVKEMQALKEQITIHFFKVKAHSGDPLNEQVDQLAKAALLENAKKN